MLTLNNNNLFHSRAIYCNNVQLQSAHNRWTQGCLQTNHAMKAWKEITNQMHVLNVHNIPIVQMSNSQEPNPKLSYNNRANLWPLILQCTFVEHQKEKISTEKEVTSHSDSTVVNREVQVMLQASNHNYRYIWWRWEVVPKLSCRLC